MKSIDWTKRKDLLIFISIFVAAAIVFAQYTLEGILYRDDALHLYIGQQFVKGIPPYVSAIDVKTPLSFMLIGFGIMLSMSKSWYLLTFHFFTADCVQFTSFCIF